jgi:hypothetical protein
MSSQKIHHAARELLSRILRITPKLFLDLRLVKELSLRKVHRVFSFLDLYRDHHSSACSKYNVCAGILPRPWCELKRGELDMLIV